MEADMFTRVTVLVGIAIGVATLIYAHLGYVLARRALPPTAGPVTVERVISHTWHVHGHSEPDGSVSREPLPWWVLVILIVLGYAWVLSMYLRYRPWVLSILFVAAVLAMLAWAGRVWFIVRRRLAGGRVWRRAWALELVGFLGVTVLAGLLRWRDNPWEPFGVMRQRVQREGWLSLFPPATVAEWFAVCEVLTVGGLFVLLGIMVAQTMGTAVALFQTASGQPLTWLAGFAPRRSRALWTRPLWWWCGLAVAGVVMSPWCAEMALRLTTQRIAVG